jgi:hypothetical protein
MAKPPMSTGSYPRQSATRCDSGQLRSAQSMGRVVTAPDRAAAQELMLRVRDNYVMASYVPIDTNLLAETTRLLRTGLGPCLLYFAKIRERKIPYCPRIRSAIRESRPVIVLIS